MSKYFRRPYESFNGDINVKFDLSNYATKTNIKNVSNADTLNLDIDKLKSLPNDLSNLKNKVDKLDADKLASVPVDLSKLNNAVKNEVVKKTEYNAQIKCIDNKIPDITNLATKTILNTKINEVKNEIPSISCLATTSALTTVEN